MSTGPVTFINCFEVADDAEERFLAEWRQVNDYMRTKPGYVDHTLHRSVQPGSRYRFVNVAHWASVEDWEAAHDAGFRAIVDKPGWGDFPSTPGLFEPVDRHRA